MNLSALDLNLLLVLHTVLEERSVARAARSLHVTSSAVSNALGRLREALGDPLLVRQGRGLVPTPRALALAPKIKLALAELQQALEGEPAFEPEKSTRRFVLACSDNDQLACVPRIASAFAARLPGAQLRVMSIEQLESSDGLVKGEVDALIGPKQVAGSGLRSTELYRDDAVLVLRRDHPLVGRRLTREVFNRLRHVDLWVTLEGPGAGNRAIEKFFAQHGLKRNVALIVPSFSAAVLLASRSDLAAGVPRRLAEELQPQLQFRICELPVPVPPFEMHLIWHQRTHSDAGARYFRELVLGAIRGRKGQPSLPAR